MRASAFRHRVTLALRQMASGISRAAAGTCGVRPLREAAVLMGIYAASPHRVVFVERAAHLRDHPGQIGFPGGSVDPADGNDRARTALREAHEEIGVPADHVRIVDRLPDVRQRANNYLVTPFVGVLRNNPPLVIDPAETAAVFTVPLGAIVAPDAVHWGIETIGELAIETWIFNHDDRHVWGLTARMLHDFVVAWNLPESPLRAAIEAALIAAG